MVTVVIAIVIVVVVAAAAVAVAAYFVIESARKFWIHPRTYGFVMYLFTYSMVQHTL
jgi:hypothetical protein